MPKPTARVPFESGGSAAFKSFRSLDEWMCACACWPRTLASQAAEVLQPCGNPWSRSHNI